MPTTSLSHIRFTSTILILIGGMALVVGKPLLAQTAAYPTLVMSNAPYGYWRFNETAGTTAYGVGGVMNGSYSNCVLGAAGPQPPLYPGFEATNLAPQFNGTNSGITFGTNASLNGPGDFTVIAWVNTTAITSGYVIQQRDGTGYQGEYALSVNGSVNFYLYNGAYQFNTNTLLTVNDGRWHLVAGVRSGTNGFIYVDGQLAASASGTVKSLNSSLATAVGFNLRDGNSYFNGSIDEVAIFTNALSAGTLLSLYQAATLVLPAAPASISPVALASNLISVTWPAASYAGGYVLSRNGSAIAALSGTSYLDLGLSSGTTYSYSVVATNAAGSSPASVTNSATTPTGGIALWWDANGSAATAQDGSGNWGASANTWWNGSANVAWADNSLAIFGNGAMTNCAVIITNSVTPAGMIFNANKGGNYILSGVGGSLLQLSGTPTITCNDNATIGAPLNGGGLIKAGSGTLTLTAANTHTGVTAINAGTLALSGGGSISSSANVIVSNATLDVSGVSGTTTLNNLNMTNGVINLGATTVNVSALNLGGLSNVINLAGATLPGILSYPTNFTLIQSAGGISGYNFVLGSLPAGSPAYTGSIATNGNAVVLTLTAGPTILFPATVSFPATNAGLVLNPAFCGLSYEKSQLTGSLLVSNDTSLVGMFSQITPAVLRIGGNSVNTTCWGGLSNQTAITAAEVDAFAGFVKALPTNWHVIYGINQITNNPANCATEAAYAANALGSRLLGFEIGNEPDDYVGNGYRPATYTYAQFLAEWRALAAGITNAVPGWAITNGGNGWVLTGPANSWDTADYTVPFASDEAGVNSMLTQHFYLGNPTNATWSFFLQQPISLLLTRVTNGVPAATAANLPLGYRVGECGSFYNGGAPGYSDAYGSALWTLDFLFTVALNGGQGVNLQSGGQSHGYTPIADNGSAVVQARPEFYGLKMFSLMSQGSVVPAVVSLASNINFNAYGVRRTNGLISVLLNNKETNDYVQVSVNLGTNVPAAQLTWLTGPALSSTSGYTLGGAPINADGSWAGGIQSVISTTNGQLNLIVPPISAVLVNSFVPASTNAFLASLSLAPGALSPAFTTNGFIYWATNSYAQTPSVTISNADPTETSTLCFNGKPPVTLSSGVASPPLPLSVGTNLMQVLVTAQDGVTTNLYTVNVIVLPPATHNLNWTTASNTITDGAGIWYQTSNSVTAGNGAWFDGASYHVAMQGGDNVTFGGGTAGAVATVTNGPGLTPGSITLTNAYGGGGYTIGTATSTNSITMSGGLITNSGSSASATIYSAINGSFTFGGNSSLVLGGNGNQSVLNTVTVVAGSTLQIGNNGNAGSLGAAVITNNGTINWKRNGQNNPVNISNVVYGTGSVKLWGNGATFVVLGTMFHTGTTTLQPSASTSTNCLVQLGGNNVLPTTTALTIAQNGLNQTNTQTFDLNGFNQTVGSLAGDTNATATSEVITNSSATPATLTLGGTNKTTGYGGLIAGNLSLVLNGTGSTLTLSNVANTYAGTTTINAGKLQLTASSSIASPSINLSSSAAAFDVSTVTGGYTLGNGQTLSGIGVVTGAVTTASGSIIAPGNAGGVGTLNFSNNLTLNGNLVFKINKSLAQSNDLITVVGRITNNGTGTLTVNNLGPTPVAGDKFKLFSSAVVNGGSLTITSSLGTNFVNNLAVDGSISLPPPKNLKWTSVSGSLTEGGGTWNQGSASITSGNGAWYDGTNYGLTMQSGDNVTFGGGTAGAVGTIASGTALTPGNITFANPYGGGAYTIGSSTADPAITMSGGLITNSSSSGPTINCPLNGGFIFYNNGGTFTLGGNGNQTSANAVTIASGTLQIGNNGNAGSLGAAVITNNGAMQWKRNGQNNPINVANAVYGTGTVKFWGNGATFVVLSNMFYTGTTILQPTASTAPNNLLQLGGNNVLSTNTALNILQTGANPTNTEALDLNGFNQTLGSLVGDQYATATSEVVTNSSATLATLTLGGSGTTAGFGGLIAGNLGLVLKGSGSTLILSNADTYTGNTTINAGALALKGGGSITGTPIIGIASGAIFNVSGLTTPFTLGGSQTLTNTGTGAVINGTNNTGSGTVAITYDGANPSFIITNGGMTLSAATVFNVNNTGSTLATGSYKLISKAATGNLGLVTGTAPAAVTVAGNGAAGSASLQITNGQLNLVVSPSLPGTGTNLLFSVSGNQLNLSWPTNYAGWLLQSNSVNLASSNYWFTVPGSAASNRLQIIIAPGNANVFYRMAHP